MKEPKYPDDFREWIPVDGWTTPKGWHYLVLDSPDGREQCCVHLEDGDVLGIRDKLTGRYRYGGVDLQRARDLLSRLRGGKEDAKKGSV